MTTQSEPDGGVWQDSYGDPWWRDDDGLWHCTDGWKDSWEHLQASYGPLVPLIPDPGWESDGEPVVCRVVRRGSGIDLNTPTGTANWYDNVAAVDMGLPVPPEPEPPENEAERKALLRYTENDMDDQNRAFFQSGWKAGLAHAAEDSPEPEVSDRPEGVPEWAQRVDTWIWKDEMGAASKYTVLPQDADYPVSPEPELSLADAVETARKAHVLDCWQPDTVDACGDGTPVERECGECAPCVFAARLRELENDGEGTGAEQYLADRLNDPEYRKAYEDAREPDTVPVYLSREDAEDWARSRWMSGSVGERSVAAARAALEANPRGEA